MNGTSGPPGPATTSGSGTVSPSTYSTSSTELPISVVPDSRHEMLTAENSGLRDRVAELERKVQEQEDELVCLRSSMADVLRRLNQLESAGMSSRSPQKSSLLSQSIMIGSSSSSSGVPMNMANRSLSRSTGNLRKHSISVVTNDMGPANRNIRRTVSPSPKRIYGVHQGGSMQNGPTSPSPISPSPVNRAQSMRRARGSISVGTSAPNLLVDSGNIKKWVSSQDFSDGPWSPGSPGKVGNPCANLHKDPIFDPDEKILQIYIRGRPVNLIAPSSVGSGYSPFTSNPPPSEKGRSLNYVTLLSSQGTCDRPKRLSSPTEMDALVEEGENLPHVRVWDSITLQTQHVLGIGDFERAVSCVAFSKSDGGGLLAVVDESYEHTLSVWDWQRKRKITETKSANEQVFSCEFHPTEKHLLVTCGKSQLNFWMFDGVTLQKKMGIFEGRDKPKYVLCMCFSEWGEVLSGDSNGTISVWDWKTGRTCRQVAKVHQGGVFALCSLRGGRLLSGGGKDRRILEWTADLKPTGRSTEVPESAGPVRTISQGKGSLILIGTTHNAILQGSVDLGFSFIAQGHIDELWGLCSHPLQQQFLTCGYDKTLRLWDSISHCLVWVKEIADPAKCSCFHPDGSIFVVGTTIGRWLVLDATTRDVVIGQKDGNDIISSLNYSPDGRMLAVASHDGNVYVYSVSDDARRYNRTHASFVTAVDWSADGQFLRTNSGDHEVLFWYAIQCKALLTPSFVRDVQWATDWCSLSFQVFGAWPDGADGTEINACAASHDRQLLAVADDAGSVRILRYPSSQPKSSSSSYSGHSSHVTSVRFLANDSRLISIGGKDSAVFQWTVTKLS